MTDSVHRPFSIFCVHWISCFFSLGSALSGVDRFSYREECSTDSDARQSCSTTADQTELFSVWDPCQETRVISAFSLSTGFIYETGSIFTARRYVSAVYAVVVCLLDSVCVSVTPGIVSKRLSLGSREQRHMIAIRLRVSAAKDLIEIWMGVIHTGATNTGEWVKIGYFRQVTGYNSKTVQDKRYW